MTPELHELQHLQATDGRTVRVIEEVAKKWKEVAIALRFGSHEIKSLESDAQHISEHACREMFIKWLNIREDLRRPLTWTTLIQCLREAKLVETAKKLECVCLNRKQVRLLLHLHQATILWMNLQLNYRNLKLCHVLQAILHSLFNFIISIQQIEWFHFLCMTLRMTQVNVCGRINSQRDVYCDS